MSESDEFAAWRERRLQVEREIAAHPAYVEHRLIEGFQRTLGMVFRPNLRELVALLERAAMDPHFALQVVQNVQRTSMKERFAGEAVQRLHNYVASAMTLVDHTRRIMRGRSDDIGAEFATRNCSPIPRFCLCRTCETPPSIAACRCSAIGCRSRT